jgi:hypothetical protein
VFDPVVQGQITISLRKSIEPRRNDPLVIGWSIGNEYEEIIKPAEIAGILKKESSVPAKRSLVDYALKSLYNGSISHFTTAWGARARTAQELYAAPLSAPKDDVEALRRFYEESYYDLLYRTVKTIDPHHLYLGCWIVPGWWENEEDWRLTAAHCDVVGYDRYAPQFTDELLSRLVKASNKPILCGEFSYPEHYHGARGYGRYDAAWAESEADAGDDYGRWTEAASTNPYCVGINWFEYRDQPLTGRGPGRGPDLIYGEHYAFGIVDISDRPKWDLVERMRKANLQTTARRLAATAAGASPDTHAAPLGP